MATLDELKATVLQTLENTGVLSDIRARLRATVFKVYSLPGNRHARVKLKGRSGILSTKSQNSNTQGKPTVYAVRRTHQRVLGIL